MATSGFSQPRPTPSVTPNRSWKCWPTAPARRWPKTQPAVLRSPDMVLPHPDKMAWRQQFSLAQEHAHDLHRGPSEIHQSGRLGPGWMDKRDPEEHEHD